MNKISNDSWYIIWSRLYGAQPNVVLGRVAGEEFDQWLSDPHADGATAKAFVGQTEAEAFVKTEGYSNVSTVRGSFVNALYTPTTHDEAEQLEQIGRYVDMKCRTAVRTEQERIAEIVVEYPEGCEDGRRDFLVACGLDEFIPENEVEVSFSTTATVTVPWGGDTDDAISEYMQYSLETGYMDYTIIS